MNDAIQIQYRDLHEQIARLQAENADLRVMLAEHGVEAPLPTGALSLSRIRAYEAVRFWAHTYRRNPTDENGVALDRAIVEAEAPR